MSHSRPSAESTWVERMSRIDNLPGAIERNRRFLKRLLDPRELPLKYQQGLAPKLAEIGPELGIDLAAQKSDDEDVPPEFLLDDQKVDFREAGEVVARTAREVLLTNAKKIVGISGKLLAQIDRESSDLDETLYQAISIFFRKIGIEYDYSNVEGVRMTRLTGSDHQPVPFPAFAHHFLSWVIEELSPLIPEDEEDDSEDGEPLDIDWSEDDEDAKGPTAVSA